ncbi:MAG TPA: hypothetical protein PLP17_00550 [Oligoflexia bacterium]|nr:hypothetical protein [Oligoflexia bacterium]
MTGLKQALADLKLIVTTDHRVWAAAAFICVVSFVWVATGAWREPEPEPPEKMVPVKIKPEKIPDFLQGLTQQMKEAKEEREYLRDMMNRTSHEIEVDKEVIDWNANTLITRLNDVSEKVDKVANMVGEAAIEKAQLEKKIKKQQPKKRGKHFQGRPADSLF